MRQPLSLLAISIVVTVMQLPSLEPWQAALAETSDEDEAPTSLDITISAGTAAGLVEACGVDVTPIGSAFKMFLARTNLPSPGQQNLMKNFKAAEDAALSTLAGAGPSSCTGATGVMRATVHSLTKPPS
jgi:hypothetical protein